MTGAIRSATARLFRRGDQPPEPADAAVTDGWVRPWALDHRGAVPVRTALGAIDGPALATVDGHGLITPGGAGWSLDWWVGADDRWRVPSREVAVRQSADGGAPVVETAMRIPAGDAVQRVYAAQVPDGHVVVIEVENRSTIPFALAWAVRPFTAVAPGRIGRVAIDGPVIEVDGSAVVLDRVPGRVATGGDAGDPVALDLAETVFAGSASVTAQPATSEHGLAQAVAIVPVPHRATVRAVVPLHVGSDARREFPAVLPAATDVVSGWSAHVDTSARLVMPEGRLDVAFGRARRRVLLGATEGGHLHPAIIERAEPLLLLSLVDALVDFGHDAEAAGVLAAWFLTQPIGLGAVAPAIVALERYWRATADDALVGAAQELLRDGVADVANETRRMGGDPSPALVVWAAGALRAGSTLLGAIGDRRASGDADLAAVHAAAASDHALGRLAEHPDGAAEGRTWAVLGATALGVVPAAHPAISALTATAAASPPDPAFDPVRALDLAAVEIARGDAVGVDRLEAVAGAASPTGVWGSGDDGDLAVAARLVRAARRLCTTDLGADSHGGAAVTVCPAWPAKWLGQPVEAHGIRVGSSTVSFAVRWHGARPALLWDVTGPAVQLRCGLDPTWHTAELSGDALLAEPAGTRG